MIIIRSFVTSEIHVLLTAIEEQTVLDLTFVLTSDRGIDVDVTVKR